MVYKRWPIRLAPAGGEAMSSWLARLGALYGMSAQELAKRDLGLDVASDFRLDLELPPAALERLCERSGVDSQTLQGMTLAGFNSDAAREYSSRVDISVLLPRQVPTFFLPSPAKHWRFPQLPLRACLICIDGSGDGSYKLAWRHPLQLSCEIHGVLLTEFRTHEWSARQQSVRSIEPQLAEPAIAELDARTLTALRGQPVRLSRGDLTSPAWLSLVHRVVDELAMPALISQMPARTRLTIGLLDGDRPVPGQLKYGDFETSVLPVQRRRVVAAARLLAAVADGRLVARGAHPGLGLVRPLQPTGFTPSLFLTYGDTEAAAVQEAFSMGTWKDGEGVTLHQLIDDSSRFPRLRYLQHLLLERMNVPWPERASFERQFADQLKNYFRTADSDQQRGVAT